MRNILKEHYMNTLKKSLKGKKGVMGQIISVFVLMLVISVLAGMTFLFMGTFKTQIGDTTPKTPITVVNETLTTVTETGETVTNAGVLKFLIDTSLVYITNASTNAEIIESGNYTVDANAGIISFTGLSVAQYNNTDWNITYTYSYISGEDEKSYLAVNKTEQAGYQTVSYLGILFLALIFGAILTVVLRVILPYINLGQQVGGF